MRNCSCNVQSNALKNIARQIAEYMLHTATYLATLEQVEDWSTFPVTCNTIFSYARQIAKRGCYTCTFILILSSNGIALQVAGKLPRITAPFISSATT